MPLSKPCSSPLRNHRVVVERLRNYLSWWNGLDRKERDLHLDRLRRNKISQEQKREIKALYDAFVHKGVSWSCGSCVMDAHVLLTKLNPEAMIKISEYQLRAGTVLPDPINKDFALLLTPERLTKQGEDLALYHLAFNPRASKFFIRMPDDVESRIGEFLKKQDGKLLAHAQNEKARIFESLRNKLSAARELYSALMKQAETTKDVVAKLTAELKALEESAKTDGAVEGQPAKKVTRKPRVAATPEPTPEPESAPEQEGNPESEDVKTEE